MTSNPEQKMWLVTYPTVGEVMVDSGFLLEQDPDTVRGPDVSFISQAHRGDAAQGDPYPEMAPDLVVEIISPGDESYAKLPFYAAHSVDELVIVEPDERAISWLTLRPSGTSRSSGAR